MMSQVSQVPTTHTRTFIEIEVTLNNVIKF